MSSSHLRNWLLEQKNPVEKRNFKALSISIASGKGGVGKTSISIKMAKILAEFQYRVLLIDFDYNLANISLKLGQPVSDDFIKLLRGEKKFDDVLYKEKNLHILTGCNGNSELLNKTKNIAFFMIDIMKDHEKEYDYIILDCPPGLQKDSLLINTYSDYRFFIVTSERTSITDAYALIKVLNKEYGVKKNHLLLNKISTSMEKQKITKALIGTTHSFLNCHLQLLGSLDFLSCPIDQFDRYFLRANHSTHKILYKIMETFSEEIRNDRAL